MTDIQKRSLGRSCSALLNGLWVVALMLGLGVFASLAGCKKPAPIVSTVALSGADLNADGTLNDAAMQKIEEQTSGGKDLDVRFVRAPLSDAGLNQLAKFTTLRHVDAFGSKITPAGIDKLKQTLPGVEVRN